MTISLFAFTHITTKRKLCQTHTCTGRRRKTVRCRKILHHCVRNLSKQIVLPKRVFVWQTLPQQDVKRQSGAFSTERRQLVKNIIDVACNGKTPPDITIEITGKFENSGTKIWQKSYYEMQTQKKTNGFFKRWFLQCKNFPKIVDRVKKQNYNVSNLSGR